MSRSVSSDFREAAYLPQTGEAEIVLLTIDHEDLADPIRVCGNGEDVTSNGEVFTASHFEFLAPDENDNRPPQARLRIQNVDRAIIDEVRTLTTPPTITAQIVLASSPDTIEAQWPGLELKDVNYDAAWIESGLGFETLLEESAIGHHFQPVGFPGLFG